MRLLLLDTTPLTAVFNNRPNLLAWLTPHLARDEATTSVLAYGELVEWLKGAPDFPRRLQELRRMLRGIRPYGLSYRVMERYADIRRQVRPPFGPGMIGDVDTLIAATALTHDLELVTTDGDFTRVPGLRVRLLDRATFRPVVR